jgi:lipopolysaccharide transport system permease protein
VNDLVQRLLGGSPEWVEIRPSRGLLGSLSLRELIDHRFVAVALAQRSLAVRHKQTVLGIAWIVLLPLVSVVVYSLVFGRLAGLPSGGVPYPVFVFSGLVAWNYFSSGLTQAAWSLVQDQELITKVYFPRVLAPVAAALPPLLDMAIEVVVLAIVMVIYGVAPGLALLTLPLWIVLLVAITPGVGMLLAALNVQYRDVGQGLGFLTQTWLFITPVVYDESSVHGALRVLLSVNPMTGIVDGLRWALIGAPPPPAMDLISLGTGLLAVTASLLYFQRVERRFADFV